ncbi:MAG TPA: hypothetical protein GXZ60_16285 [Intrasporangiaceae bacterium]|nr:hypothetical protein [Intrasporangiaceae bacterium]
MALAPSWGSVAAPGLRTPELPVPARRPAPSIPVYPAGRHRGARRSFFGALFAALLPQPRYVGRHRSGFVGTTYVGRHRG